MTPSRPYPLVQATDLLEHAGPTIVLDVQFTLGDPGAGALAHAAAHVPGARHCDLDTVLAGPPGAAGGRHPLPAAARLQEDLRDLGLHQDSRVVVYDASNGFAAARAWWVLGWVGLGDVRILDGGLDAWSAAGGPVESGPAVAAPHGDLVVRPGALRTLDANGAAGLARSGVLLDARARPRYGGEQEPIDPVAGHIPGARNAPVTDVMAPDGRYRSASDLVRWFTEQGVSDAADVGVYCGSGVSAAQEVVALRLAGVNAG